MTIPQATTVLTDAVTASPATLLYPAPVAGQTTICVLGVARGGTSMVAGLLHRLGVFMGDNRDPSTGEDRDFLRHAGDRAVFTDASRGADRAGYVRHITALIAHRGETHTIWGWKDPLASFYLPAIASTVQGLRIILVVRDIAAIAQRENRQEFSAAPNVFADYAINATCAYGDMFDYVRRHARPTLVVSYERCLRAPREFAHLLADFVGIRADREFADWAARYIEPDRGTGEPAVADSAAFRAGLLGRSHELRLLLSESVAIGRIGYLNSASGANGGTAPSAAALLTASVDALNSGTPQAARDLAYALLQTQIPMAPALGDGVLGALASCQIGARDAAILPDLACAALYVLGLSFLLTEDAPAALAYLTAAEAAMRVRLLQQMPESYAASDNYWGAVFHTGMAASALGRSDSLLTVMSLFGRAAHADPDPAVQRLGGVSLDVFWHRAQTELA